MLKVTSKRAFEIGTHLPNGNKAIDFGSKTDEPKTNCCDANMRQNVFIWEVFILINNQLLSTSSAKDISTDYYILNSTLASSILDL